MKMQKHSALRNYNCVEEEGTLRKKKGAKETNQH